jgi:aspartyl aminopeptidase
LDKTLDEVGLDDLIAFLASAPTPFHAVRAIADRLDGAGYLALDEGAPFALEAGGRYYTIRNGGSVIAFRLPEDATRTGLRMVGAHTDSPCLRLKPTPVLQARGLTRLGVEVYGGALLNPWFDRDLSLAGRVHFEAADGTIGKALVDFRRPIAVVPSLAIHLDREANASRSVNAQKDIPPLIAAPGLEGETFDVAALLLDRLHEEHPEVRAARILDHELCFYDTQAPSRVGARGEFLASARLDNLLSCWCGLQALLESDESVGALLVCNDHEEVGSASSSGAAGPFLRSVLERIAGGLANSGGAADAFAQLVARSMLISADNAHAVHPNFPDRHDDNHGPSLGGGPVIKVNANQRYASNSATQALFRQLCDRAGIPVQTFVTRTDMACGSTIGPITASEIGVRTLDVGVPQLAMHSIRELCHAEDPQRMAQVLAAFQSLAELPPLD